MAYGVSLYDRQLSLQRLTSTFDNGGNRSILQFSQHHNFIRCLKQCSDCLFKFTSDNLSMSSFKRLTQIQLKFKLNDEYHAGFDNALVAFVLLNRF